jgi:hypothetical protein
VHQLQQLAGDYSAEEHEWQSLNIPTLNVDKISFEHRKPPNDSEAYAKWA